MKKILGHLKYMALMGAVAGSLVAASAPVVHAQDAPAKDVFSAEQKAALQEMFKDYLMNHADVLLSSVDNYRKKEELKSQQSSQENLKLYKDYLLSSDRPMAGNPNGDVTIVEFFDFNCGYCKRAYADIKKLLKEDKNVRIVFQELPILSPTSMTMAALADAAAKQGKYFAMHSAFMEYHGPQSDAAFKKLAQSVGVDVDKAMQDAASPEIKQEIDKSKKIAVDLGIRGTPGFVIGNEIYPGYIGYDGMKDIIAQVRKQNAAKQ